MSLTISPERARGALVADWRKCPRCSLALSTAAFPPIFAPSRQKEPRKAHTCNEIHSYNTLFRCICPRISQSYRSLISLPFGAFIIATRSRLCFRRAVEFAYRTRTMLHHLYSSLHHVRGAFDVALGCRQIGVPGEFHDHLWADAAVRQLCDKKSPATMATRAINARLFV